jgi:hypothetical protein
LIYARQRSIIAGKTMYVPPTAAWKLVLAVALFAAVLASAWVRPPRRPVPRGELRRLVLGAVALYGVGLAASLTHHRLMAVILYSLGIGVSALTAWLSRAATGSDPPSSDPPADEPPPEPDGAPRFDWPQFERELEAYARRGREPAETP